MFQIVIKFFIIAFFFFYSIVCFNADAVSYMSDSGNIEIERNDNRLDFHFNLSILLSVTYQGFENNIIFFTPTFDRTYETTNGGFEGACHALCSELETLSEIVQEANYNTESNTNNIITLRLINNIRILNWRGRQRHQALDLRYNIEFLATSQKFLRVLNMDIPNRTNHLELLNDIKNSDINFLAEGANFIDGGYHLVPFTLDQNPDRTHITSELLFKLPFSNFITVERDDTIDSTWRMIPKTLLVETQEQNIVTLDFYDQNKDSIRDVSIHVNQRIIFPRYINDLIQIVRNNLLNSPFFLARSNNHTFEFLRGDQINTAEENLITVAIVDHKLRIQFQNQTQIQSFHSHCTNIANSVDPASNTTLLLNDSEDLLDIQEENSIKKIVCSPDITYYFLEVARPDTYLYERVSETRTYNLQQNELIDCPSFTNLAFNRNYVAETSNPSDELRELITTRLRNFISIDINNDNSTITFLPKSIEIVNPNPDNYLHLFLPDDEFIENKLKCSTFIKLISEKDQLLRNWTNFLVENYSIAYLSDSIRIRFTEGYAKFVLDRNYRGKRLIVNEFNSNFKRLISSQNIFLDDLSYRDRYKKSKPEYTNIILGPIQTEISTAQAVTEYNFTQQSDDHALVCYNVTPKYDFFKIKFQFFKKLFRENRRETIYPSSSRQKRIYLNRNPLNINNDPDMSNTYQLSSPKKLLNNQLNDLDQYYKQYHLPATLQQYSIHFFNSTIDSSHRTIIGRFYLKDNTNKILIVYYPLQYNTSYRSNFPDDERDRDKKDRYINLIDRRFRDFLERVLGNRTYNRVFIRFADNMFIDANTDYDNAKDQLFHNEGHYDNHDFFWNNDSLRNDYRTDIQNTSSFVDIIYLDSIRRKSRIIQKFNNFRNINKIYFLNIISQQTFQRIQNISQEISGELSFLNVININYDSFEDTNYDLFSSNVLNLR